MARLTISERMRIAAISASRRRRGMAAQASGLPGVRWLKGPPRVDQLLIVPQDLRPVDPSFWFEVRHDQFGLAGSLARLGGHSPFDLVPPGPAWERSLHGFGWLRHLHAAEDDEAAQAARRLAIEWTIRHGGGSGFSWQPAILARRIISWISHATLLLDGSDEQNYDAITRSLGAQLLRLSTAWREAEHGYPRLLSLTALLLADLTVAGRDRFLEADLRLFLDELRAQIRSDGGHASRNSTICVNLLLDLLPLRECFRSRGRPHPDELDAAIARMLAFLKAQRLGDGLLARFNGVGVPQPASVATVLAYGEIGKDPLAAPTVALGRSGYARIDCGETTVIMDCAGPPPLELAAQASAGCLSFELSCATTTLLSNGGLPGSGHADWVAAARSTASHNTLVLGEQSSSRLVSHARVKALLGQSPLRGPAHVTAERFQQEDGAVGIEARHDGYLDRQGVLHQRRIAVAPDGRRIVGTDWLKPPRGTLRLKSDVPFSIHFHLHPGITCRRADKVGSVTIEGGAQRWRMLAEGARLVIEESIYFADAGGPVQTLQVVLRGATFGETEVRWSLTRID